MGQPMSSDVGLAPEEKACLLAGARSFLDAFDNGQAFRLK